MRFRAGVLLAVLSVPSALGLSWLGCAAGDDEVEGAPKRNTGDTSFVQEEASPGIDTGGTNTDAGGGIDTAKPTLCPGDVGAPNECASATDLGSIAVGSTKSVTERLPEKGGDIWYKVKFDTLENPAAHPRVTVTSTDGAIVLEVTKTCAGDTVSCGDEDAFAVRIKDYEVVYRADPASMGPATPDAFLPIIVGDGGTVYIRVFRTSGAPTGCDFKLDLSN